MPLTARQLRQLPVIQPIGRGQYFADEEGLIKAENTIAILLRTGIIGLKDWLYWVGVLVGSLRCECGWPRQTPKHIILACPLCTN